MKKPEGKADAGWYDAPEVEGYVQYWNGKFWTKYKQVKDGTENLEPLPAVQLGKFLFRNPIMNDGVFIAYAIVIGFASLYLISDYFEFSSGLTSLAILIPAIVITIIWIYILFLIVLIPRRIKDKKNSLVKGSKIDYQKFISSPDENNSKKSRNKYLTVIVVLIFVLLIFITQSKSGFEKDADAFFNKQQEISSVLSDWNKESALLFGVIQKVSSGELDFASSVYSVNEINAKISPIMNALSEKCADVPAQSLDKTGELLAIALSWNMLKVTCDLVPLQRIEYLAIFDAQWSESANQSKIDYHVERLSDLAQQRKDAALQAVVEIEKYASGSQLEQVQSLIKLLS
jgi:hypothetical protein